MSEQRNKDTRRIVIVGSVVGSFSRLAALSGALVNEFLVSSREGINVITSEPSPEPECLVMRPQEIKTFKSQKTHPDSVKGGKAHRLQNRKASSRHGYARHR